jgi:hypothetical protein
MGRGSTSSKRQPGANQRDTRHENGLVGPSKRVLKQKSNGHLNGQAKSSESTSSTPPLPSTPPASNGHIRQPALGDSLSDHRMGPDIVRRASVGAGSDSSASEVYHHPSGSPASQENHRQIDVTSAKTSPTYHRDPFTFALTVLRSCPLWDTLAILIVLLQIPPTFLSMIHLLFATLTFVPPSTVATSGLSFTDILQGTLGTPSFGTIFLIDMVVLLVWLFLWSPLQDIALDLAQTVIALTLGGGTSGREAGMRNVLWCFGVIGASHIFSGGKVKHAGLRSLISSNGLLGPPDSDEHLKPSPSTGNRKHGLIRSILAIHILTQGVVRYIRDWYVRREKRDSSATIGDPEAGKVTLDTSSDSTTSAQAIDTDSSATLAVGSTSSALKKKKKHSAQVRIRQPLWAALASTKIVMVKEYETSHTAAESAGTNATDMNNLGNAPFRAEADRIWITYVGSDEVFFSTSFFPIHSPMEGPETTGIDASACDKAKPFSVKINNTDWPSTRINPITDLSKPLGQEMRWNGEISGLAPTSNYLCEFLSTVDKTILFSTNFRTLQSTKTEIAGLAPSPQVTGRPGSPITTLKTSIASAELKLTEERNRQKRERKDQRAKLSGTRKEIDRLNSNIASTGSNDDNQKKKIQQSTLHRKQAEEATAVTADKIEQLESSPADDAALYASAKSEIQSQRDKHKKKRSDFNGAKQNADQDLQVLKTEISSAQTKVESKQARLTYLSGKHDLLVDANAKGLDEVQRKENERQSKRQQREGIREFYHKRILDLESEIAEGTNSYQMLYNAITQLESTNALYAQHQSPTTSSQNLAMLPGYPEMMPENNGMNVNAYPWNPPVPPMAGVYSGYNGMLGGVTSSTSQGFRTRGRSSSMLSNVSKFTQSSDEGQIPGMGSSRKLIWEDAREDRKGSSGSGSGSGSGAGSVVDSKSPTVAHVKASIW